MRSSCPLLRLVPLLMGLTLSSPAFANCADTSSEDLQLWAQQARLAFEGMDSWAFDVAQQRLMEGLECVAELPDRRLAAEVYEVMALDAFRRGDNADALAALQAMLSADPARELSSNLAPRGGPLYSLLVQARQAGLAPLAPQALPEGWRLLVDGQQTMGLPQGRPALVVVMDSDRVVWIGMVLAGGALPDGILGPPVPPPTPEPNAPPAQTLKALAAGSLLVSSGLWAAFALDLREYNSVNGRALNPELQARYVRVRGLEGAAIATSAIAAGFGVGCLVLGRADSQPLRVEAGLGQARLVVQW